MSQPLEDFISGWRSPPSQPSEPTTSPPAIKNFLPIMFDSEAAPEAGAAFDGQTQLATDCLGNDVGRLVETAGAAKVNHDS